MAGGRGTDPPGRRDRLWVGGPHDWLTDDPASLALTETGGCPTVLRRSSNRQAPSTCRRFPEATTQSVNGAESSLVLLLVGPALHTDAVAV